MKEQNHLREFLKKYNKIIKINLKLVLTMNFRLGKILFKN